ncbi:hypothetical protein [Brucella sp. 10RB9215]|uniref:hypothetical protein n=1 Tax=Brucella sp. 10RB9215 TaxID=1149953 RepID=UPI0010FEEFAE|nr:hypothetical protein [Brucella sp. 10RB9215]
MNYHSKIRASKGARAMQIPVVDHKDSTAGRTARLAAARIGVSLKKGVVFHIDNMPYVVVETGCFGMPHLFAYERMTQRDPITVIMEEAIKREKKFKERVRPKLTRGRCGWC